MKNKKKGFTLIELLAVIVILAIIALISTPIVLNIIEKSRKASFTRSLENIVKTGNLYYMEKLTENESVEDTFRCNKYECISKSKTDEEGNPLKLDIDGYIGTGEIAIDNDGNISFELDGYGYCGRKEKEEKEIKVTRGNCNETTEDTTGPIIESINTSKTANSITIVVNAYDDESGISLYEYSINGSEYKKGNNTYTFNDLSDGTYTIKVKVTNGENLYTESEKEITIEKAKPVCPIPIITIENKENWEASKNVTIDYGNVEGCTGKYSLDGSNFNEGTNITVNENTFIYAINEGGETTTTSQEEITKIDNTNPNLNITKVSTTTKSIEITFSSSDEQSGIKSTTCTYGETSSYGKTGTIEGNICKITNLKNNTTYYYKITTENNAGLIKVQEGNTKTGEFSNISITPSSENYERSKTYTITGETNGAAIEYKVTNGSIVKQDWTSYTKPILVDYESTETNKTVIYARLNDGINTSSEISIEETKIDISSPLNITLSSNQNSNYNKSLNVTVTLKDEHSGLQAGSVKYGWSTSTSTAPSSYTTVNTSSTTGTNTTTFIASASNLTGSYYLWVVPVNYKDKAGNSNGATVKSTGTFNFDNTNPTNMTLSSNSDSTYSKTKSITVTLKDTGGSGLAAGSIKYGWSTSTSTAPSSYTTVNTSSTTGTSATTFTASGSNLTGSYYLWVVPVNYKDKAGNSNGATVKSTGTFNFDNTNPTLTLGTVTATDKTITIPITTKSDSHSGIKSTTCVYGTSTSYGSNGAISGSTCTISGLNASTTYYYKVTTTDNAGNSTYKTGSKATIEPPLLNPAPTGKSGLLGIVYYNPETGKQCTKSQYEINLQNHLNTQDRFAPNNKAGRNYPSANGLRTGCMKWYAYAETSTTYTMILDHDTTILVPYNSEHINTVQKEVAQALSEDTSTWKVNGRLITKEELEKITGVGTLGVRFGGQAYSGKDSSPYSWLYDYTTWCEQNGCSIEDSNRYQIFGMTEDNKLGVNYGYWTSTIYENENSWKVWGVLYAGSLASIYVTNTSNGSAVRPVITISK